MKRKPKLIYIVDGVTFTKAEFDEYESKVSENRQLVFIESYTDEDGDVCHDYEEMTDGQYADYMAGVREQ